MTYQVIGHAHNLTRILFADKHVLYVDSQYILPGNPSGLQENIQYNNLPITEGDIIQFKALIKIATDRMAYESYLSTQLRLNIFYEPSNTVGFNRNGHIYLNLAQFLVGKVMSPSYWAVVIMHELAHNRVQDHSLDFITELEHLFLYSLDRNIHCFHNHC